MCILPLKPLDLSLAANRLSSAAPTKTDFSHSKKFLNFLCIVSPYVGRNSRTEPRKILTIAPHYQMGFQYNFSCLALDGPIGRYLLLAYLERESLLGRYRPNSCNGYLVQLPRYRPSLSKILHIVSSYFSPMLAAKIGQIIN